MEFDSVTMNQDTRKALHVASVSESDLEFSKGNFASKRLEFYKYDDGDIEISIDETETNNYILDKKQVEYLLKWLAHSR